MPRTDPHEMITITHQPDNVGQYQWRARIDLRGTVAEFFAEKVEGEGCSPGDAIERCYRDLGCRMALTFKKEAPDA